MENNNFKKQMFDWQKFYKEIFDLEVDFSQTVVPNNSKTDLNFLQFMPQGLTYRQRHDKEKEMYPKYWDYNSDWPNNMDMEFEERKTDQNYAIWHSGSNEADEKYKNKPASWILKKKIKTMTRLEGGIFGLYRFWESETIIDRNTVSLWSGSRYSGGYVPSSRWHSDCAKFHSCFDDSDYSDHTFNYLRSRPVVALN